MFKQNMDHTLERYSLFWAKENHDRPLLSIYAPKNNAKFIEITPPDTLSRQWEDIDYFIKRIRGSWENTYFAAEALPHAFANLGPDVFGAFLGCKLTYGKDTSWANHYVDDWANISLKGLDENNSYFKKITEMTEALLDDSKGDYLVGITDLHPGLDGLVSLRGPDNLCFDLIDNAEEVLRVTNESYNVYSDVYKKLHDQIAKKQNGSINWMGIYHPEQWYVVGCDFMCMISNDMYKEFVEPGVIKEIELYKNSMFHLDGPGALTHLDSLLEIKELNGIQWVPGAGAKPAKDWLETLQKIQNAGKIIQINITPDDLSDLLDGLRPEGVHFITHCNSQDEADALIKMAENSYKK